MHKFLLDTFTFFKNLFYFIKVIVVFLMMALLLYWIKNTAHFEWTWLNFVQPTLDNLLSVANAICPLSYKIFNVDFELKYVSGLFILIIIALLMNLLTMGVNAIQLFYLGSRALLRKKDETAINKLLKAEMKQMQKKKNVYHVVINTYPKDASAYAKHYLNVDMNEQNEILLKFLKEKFGRSPANFENGFFYTFEDFENVDDTLEILFKILESKAPIDYAICLQLSTGSQSDDKELLKRLVKIKSVGKIYMVSDTSYRYTYNSRRNYETSQIGVFQEGSGTMELHEFKKNIL